MKIQIENSQTKVKIDRRRVRFIVNIISKILVCEDKEISISFVCDETIRRLNWEYLGRNKTTNVLSFSLQEGDYSNINPDVLGDVIISADTAQRDAVKGNLTVEQELVFLIIHGMLHLLGYNHGNTNRKETSRMRRKEKELFRKIYFSNNSSI
jgi:probable rRNA maturation factor